MGFMSYTNSWLPEDITIGRYCSIGYNVSFPKYRHPIEHISTSIFTHDYETDLVVRFTRDDKPDYANFFANPQKGEVTIGHDVWIGQRRRNYAWNNNRNRVRYRSAKCRNPASFAIRRLLAEIQPNSSGSGFLTR